MIKSHSQLPSEYKASLGYMRASLKTKQTSKQAQYTKLDLHFQYLEEYSISSLKAVFFFLYIRTTQHVGKGRVQKFWQLTLNLKISEKRLAENGTDRKVFIYAYI